MANKCLWAGALLVLIGGCDQDLPKGKLPDFPPAPVIGGGTSPTHRFEFSNHYSRPNDDTFQNATGNAGEPYEVAKVKCALVALRRNNLIRFRFVWSASMTTGRHVEAGNFFALSSDTNTLANPHSDKVRNLRISYPSGATAESLPEKKVNSLLYATLNLGEAPRDGIYSGELSIRRKPELGTGVNQFNGAGPRGGIFQFIKWKVEVAKGEIKSPEVECRRPTEPHLKLIASSYQKIDPRLPVHKPYPKQPPAAICAKETVGTGEELKKEGSEIQKLAKEVGAVVTKVGCLDCHGEGNKESQLFCDDGMPLRAQSTYRAMAQCFHGTFDWKMANPDGKRRYPAGMEKCFGDFRRELGDEGMKKVSQLVEATK